MSEIKMYDTRKEVPKICDRYGVYLGWWGDTLRRKSVGKYDPVSKRWWHPDDPYLEVLYWFEFPECTVPNRATAEEADDQT